MALARETKVGLVVAASFLCLVGVVVAARLRNSQEPQTQVASTRVPAGKLTAKAESKEPKNKGPSEAAGEGVKPAAVPQGDPPGPLPAAFTDPKPTPPPVNSDPPSPIRPDGTPAVPVAPPPSLPPSGPAMDDDPIINHLRAQVNARHTDPKGPNPPAIDPLAPNNNAIAPPPSPLGPSNTLAPPPNPLDPKANTNTTAPPPSPLDPKTNTN